MKLWRSSNSSDRNVFDKLFFVFYDFQRRHTRETWFTDWIKAFQNIEQAQRATQLSSFYTSLLAVSSTVMDESSNWSSWLADA